MGQGKGKRSTEDGHASTANEWLRSEVYHHLGEVASESAAVFACLEAVQKQLPVKIRRIRHIRVLSQETVL